MLTVEVRLRRNTAERDQIRATPCATCGHAWHQHFAPSGRCWHPRIRIGNQPLCRCRMYVDPAETLEADK